MIRALGVEDAPEVGKIHAACFDRPWSEAALRDALDTPGRLALGVAGPGGRICAFILIQFSGETAEILTLSVHPSVRRQGLARTLVEAALAAARARGAARMLLDVAATNTAARALYSGRGFYEDGRRRRYYGEVDAVLLSRRLD
jgi:[ribosomal protein S18]-alanine N-acetyltransferase